MPADPSSVMPRSEGGDRGLYGVRPGDSAFKLAGANAAKMLALSGPVAGCVASASGPVSPSSTLLTLDTCVDTRIRNLPGTGAEGPDCEIDINECSRGTSDCDPNASCLDLPADSGGWVCTCRWGFFPEQEAGEEPRSPRCSRTRALDELATKTYAIGKNGTIA